MNRTPAPRLLTGVLAALLLVVLTACGAPDDETLRPHRTATTPAVPALTDLPVGRADVGPGSRVRARGSRLVVDGRVIDLAPMRVAELAVVRGGVFFRNGTELWFTDLARAHATGYDDVESLVASQDGRRFAFLDLEHGPKDRFGTPLALVVSYDATTGEPLVVSYAGMGDLATDDLRDLYEDAEPHVVRFDGEALLVHGATGGDYRLALDGGATEKAAPRA